MAMHLHYPRTFTTVLLTLSALFTLMASADLHAQGGGPTQVEFTAPPVPAGPNVNDFTGDFTYGLPILTVPGPNGGGYSLTLSYAAGANPNGDVSWVGYGWSLNPGAIVRNQRGYADDWDGDVILYNKRPVDFVVSSERSITAEVASGDLFDDDVLSTLGVSAGISETVRYDSRSGFGELIGVHGGVSLLGNYAGLQHMSDNGEGSLSSVLAPNLLATAINLSKDDENPSDGSDKGEKKPESGITKLSTGGQMLGKLIGSAGFSLTLFGGNDFSMSPPAQIGFEGTAQNLAHKIGVSATPGVVIGANVGFADNFMEIQSTPKTTLRALGYMYSDRAESSDQAVMDYHYEKDVPFLMDDEFLPIPFSGSDLFSVVGGGAFRLHNRGLSQFRQNAISSTIVIKNDEMSVNVGATFGIGRRWGRGSTEQKSGTWDALDPPDEHSWFSDGDEPWFFRYIGERGGTLLYDNSDDPVRALIHTDAGVGDWALDLFGINDEDRYASLHPDIRLQLNDWERPERTGYIGYSTNAEMLLETSGRYYHSYERDEQTRSKVADRSAMSDGIGEFALYGAGGARYVYGLPIYNKFQGSLQLGLPDIAVDSADHIKHHTRAYRYTDEWQAPTVLGQIVHAPVASMFLLTSVTTSDYVDLTGDGLSDDDLGGWTRFRYDRATGADTKNELVSSTWAYWRTPYNGLSYSEGSLSDPTDDLGGYASGSRETYYLSRIETKTHVAVFVHNTEGSQEVRKDGYPPSHYSSVRNFALDAGDSTRSSAAWTTNGNPANHHNRYLERIDLYTRDAGGEPDSLLSRTYFEYDYSLRPNMINSLPVHVDSTTRHGMLTLKKVWTEPLTVREHKVAPYIFGYEYKKSSDYSTTVQARYPEIVGYADSLTEAEENPDYSSYDLDPWGYHRPSMVTQLDNRTAWIDQTDTTLWDPAAWQLKSVRLPTGGEMHVQYEEDDYAFVHDRPVLTMVRLLDSIEAGTSPRPSSDGSLYSDCYIDLHSMGVDPTDYAEVARAFEATESLIERDKKIYFKFFYALTGDSAQWEDPLWNSDYVEGYSDVSSVTIDSVTGSPTTYAIKIRLEGKDENDDPHDYGAPKRICYDIVNKRKRGKLGPDEAVQYKPTPEEFTGSLRQKHYGFSESNHCKDLDYSKSYLRLPLIGAKRGGGLRVKRILYYDPGIEGDSMLYGTEYRYEQYDAGRDEVISSGVAANEPGAMRVENPLVRFTPRNEKDETVGKVIAGRDVARNIGMLGESLMPGPSVGYARIATHPVHQGASVSGFAVKDFYTYRDHPFDTRYTLLGNSVDYTDVQGDDYETNPLFSNFIFYRQQEHLVHRTQGYRFILTDIHGKPRNLFTNGGAYSPYEDDWFTSSSIEYDYFEPGDSIPLLYFAGDSVRYGWPGKTMEIIHANRKNGSYLTDYKVEGDAGFLYVSGMPYVMVQNSELLTHVTTKIVQYPTMLRGVKTYADGDYEYRENVAFDPATGGVAVTRTWDAFDNLVLDQSPLGHEGSYLSYSFSAEDVHPVFGTVSQNERAVVESGPSFTVVKESTTLDGPHLLFPGDSETRWLSKLTPGDLIELTLTTGVGAGRYHVESVEGKKVKLQESYLYNEINDTSFAKLGAVDVKVIRSGRLNLPGASLGGVATYGTTDDQFATASNFGWSGADATLRLAFVDQLNDSLDVGLGTFSSANVDTQLEFTRLSDSTCGNLGTLSLTISLSTAGDSLVIVSTPHYADTIKSMGLGGRFELNNGGQIVYRSASNLPLIQRSRTDPGVTQRIRNLTFCGDSIELYRTVENVIAASASVVSDSNDWNPYGVATGFDWEPDEANVFERGERGRYSTRTGYSYRTTVVGSSQPTTGERIYKRGGVFDDFSLFNWHDPALTDFTHWRGLDSVTKITGDNIPYQTVDRLGRVSSARFRTYRGDISILEQTGWNTEDATIAFESFETNAAGDYNGGVTDTVGHAGRNSLYVEDATTSDYALTLSVNDQLLEKGALLRVWMRGAVPDDVRFVIVTSTGEIEPDSIARAGAWVLWEQLVTADTLQANYVSGDVLELSIKNSGTEPIWVDDLKIQPADALSTATVYDPVTLAMMATFDNDNFGAYPVYDGEGRAVRTIVETMRGRRTIADAHANVSGVVRDWDGEGSPWGTRALVGGGMPSSSISIGGEGSGDGVDFEAVDLHIGLDDQSLKIFGVSPEELHDAVTREAGSIEKLTSVQKRLLSDYSKLHERQERLAAELAEAETEAGKEAVREQMDRVRKRQGEIRIALGLEE